MTMPTRRHFLRLTFTFAVLGIAALVPTPTRAADDHPVVVIDTTAGPITVELDRTKAPTTVDNFLKYVDAKFYDGLIFHRVIRDFMIQGGGMTETNGTLSEKEPLFPPIKNESGNGLKNERGAISMARTNDLDSATSQFYINHADNAFLDSGRYCAFGKVTDGMAVVDAIATAPTTVKRMDRGGRTKDVPVKVVTIKSIRLKK